MVQPLSDLLLVRTVRRQRARVSAQQAALAAALAPSRRFATPAGRHCAVLA